MKKEDVLKLQQNELDTDYEVSVFLDTVFQDIILESLDEVNILLDKYLFMGTEWLAINECQKVILRTIPKNLSGKTEDEFL